MSVGCLWVCGMMFVGCVWLFRHDRRTAPKFGTQVYSHLKKIDPPHPRVFRGLSIVKNLSRRTAPKFGTHVRIDTLTLNKIKNWTHPTPGLFRGLNCLVLQNCKTAVRYRRYQFASPTFDIELPVVGTAISRCWTMLRYRRFL